MSRIIDPAFYELRTKPLPTLPQRRRFLRERLAKERGHLDRFAKLAGARARHDVQTILSNIQLIEKARGWQACSAAGSAWIDPGQNPRISCYPATPIVRRSVLALIKVATIA
jgi:hypothetical protein